MYKASILTNDEGRELLKIARQALERFVRKEHLSKPEAYPIKFNETHGVLCTLLKNGEVRGRAVVGLPYPLVSLVDAAISAATTAAHEDPGSRSIIPEELRGIRIELSVLTEPKIIEAARSDVLGHIMQGVDGLMMVYGIYEAFLPPQAWAAIGTNEEFLGQLCMQAGLEEKAWMDSDIKFYKFQAQIFREE